MSYQSITIVGNIGNDPEMRYTPSGVAYTSLSIAVNKSWVKDGVKQEKVTWWRVTCWRKTAELVAQYCTKGKLVLVTATDIESKHYVDKNGEVKDTLECQAKTVRFLGGGKQDGAQAGPGAPVDSGGEVREEDIPF